jgi:hypothetical protein
MTSRHAYVKGKCCIHDQRSLRGRAAAVWLAIAAAVVMLGFAAPSAS